MEKSKESSHNTNDAYNAVQSFDTYNAVQSFDAYNAVQSFDAYNAVQSYALIYHRVCSDHSRCIESFVQSGTCT
jgi:hypothetical protein